MLLFVIYTCGLIHCAFFPSDSGYGDVHVVIEGIMTQHLLNREHVKLRSYLFYFMFPN